MATDYRALARSYAEKYGVDPYIFERQIGVESVGYAPDVISGQRRSPAGAIGIAQIMPATAKGWGVDPLNPRAALDAAAKNMAAYVKQYGSYENALRAYNAGPAAIERSRGYSETNNYVTQILRGRDPKTLGTPSSSTPSSSTPTSSSTAAPATSTPAAAPAGADLGPAQNLAALMQLTSQQQRAPAASTLAPPSFAAKPVMAGPVVPSSGGPVSSRPDISALIAASQTPGAAAQGAAPPGTTSGLIVDASTPASSPGGAGGAQTALSWAESKIGFKETGTNAGGLASYLNQRFGLQNAPWCAMFTSAAVTKGGAPSSARTASVAEVRRQAQAGGGGYQQGFVSGKSAKPGDLILFGNDHIGMVQSVKGDTIHYVGGNQSNGVTEATTKVGGGDIVRPRYGARKR